MAKLRRKKRSARERFADVSSIVRTPDRKLGPTAGCGSRPGLLWSDPYPQLRGVVLFHLSSRVPRLTRMDRSTSTDCVALSSCRFVRRPCSPMNAESSVAVRIRCDLLVDSAVDYLKDRRKAPSSTSAGLPTLCRKGKRVGRGYAPYASIDFCCLCLNSNPTDAVCPRPCRDNRTISADPSHDRDGHPSRSERWTRKQGTSESDRLRADRSNGRLARPAVHHTDVVGLPVPERCGSPMVGPRTLHSQRGNPRPQSRRECAEIGRGGCQGESRRKSRR